MAAAPCIAAQLANFTFSAAAFGPDDLKVTAFEGVEGISELFAFRVELCSRSGDIDLDALLGQHCKLEIAGDSGTRCVHGIIREFGRTGEGSSLSYYFAEIVPVHWLLTKRIQSRIYEAHRCPDMSVPGIIKKALADAGIPEHAYRFALEREYEPREFVVQYRESDMDFISRLMENEGIFYFFEHNTDGHTMVIGDSAVAHLPNPNGAEFPFRDPNGLVAEREFVFDVRDRHAIQVGSVSLDDFDFKKPKTDLRSDRQADRHAGLELSDYPGKFLDKEPGQRYAQIRLEEQQCARRIARMAATARGLLPGYRFHLFEHPTEALNREFLITHLTHCVTQPQSTEEEAAANSGTQYEAVVRAIPADLPFRPARKTPRPFVQGSQTAIVAGPEKEEIYTDKYGRVKLQFHWDREGVHDQHSSFWIRVSQGLAGGNYGMMFLPRVGQEVIVEFLEGDPDRPIITGRVYNNYHMPPYKLPDEKTRSCIKTRSTKGGGGSNEIRFDDAKDDEQFLIYGQKDLHLRVNNDRVENIGNDRHLTVDHNKIELIKGEKSVHVQGHESYKVDGTLSLTCASDLVQKLQANHKHQVKDTYAANATNIKLAATTAIELKCGGSSIILTPDAVFIVGQTVNINSGSGPPVAPVSSQATEPEAAIDADTVIHGSDTRYGGNEQDAAAAEQSEAASDSTGEDAKKKTVWIEIELVDEANQAIPDQAYELRLPDGEIRNGRLDAKGCARVNGIESGTCEICFPKLDGAAWERI